MRTLYIDIYFLINLTVDIISLYFASRFSKIKTTTRRLILSATLGALSAVGVVFFPENVWLKLLVSGVSLIIMGLVTPLGASLRRKVKFTISFLVFESLIGGIVSLIWNLFDKYLSSAISDLEGGAVNRKMLFLSLIVLLCIGVFHCFLFCIGAIVMSDKQCWDSFRWTAKRLSYIYIHVFFLHPPPPIQAAT